MRDARLRFRELQQNSAESFSPGEGLKSSISLSRGENGHDAEQESAQEREIERSTQL